MTAPAAMGESSRVRFGLTTLEYKIRRSQRRTTVSIAIDPEEGIIVTAPQRASRHRLDQIVLSKGSWITRRVRWRSDIPPSLPAREFVSGETFKYLGRQYRLKLEPGEEILPLRLGGGWLRVPLPTRLPRQQRPPYARAALLDWYNSRARAYLPGRASKWAAMLGLQEPRVLVTEPGKRWGSASRDGSIRINWRILQAPLTLVDYVLIHELVHLVHPDHSQDFWAMVGTVMPEYEDRKKRLREMGPSLVW